MGKTHSPSRPGFKRWALLLFHNYQQKPARHNYSLVSGTQLRKSELLEKIVPERKSSFADSSVKVQLRLGQKIPGEVKGLRYFRVREIHTARDHPVLLQLFKPLIEILCPGF